MTATEDLAKAMDPMGNSIAGPSEMSQSTQGITGVMSLHQLPLTKCGLLGEDTTVGLGKAVRLSRIPSEGHSNV